MGFFNRKDLISYDKLVKRESYNNSSAVEINIGHYLNTISWGKSKHWAENLKGEDFEVHSKRSWNKLIKSMDNSIRNILGLKLYQKILKIKKITLP